MKSRTDSDSQLRQNWELRLCCWPSKNQNNDWRLDLKSPEWKSQIGKDLTNLQLGSKRNYGTRKSENFWNFESGEFFRKNLNNLNKNWMLQISEYSTNPESGKNVSSSYNFFIFHFRFVDLTASNKFKRMFRNFNKSWNPDHVKIQNWISSNCKNQWIRIPELFSISLRLNNILVWKFRFVENFRRQIINKVKSGFFRIFELPFLFLHVKIPYLILNLYIYNDFDFTLFIFKTKTK